MIAAAAAPSGAGWPWFAKRSLSPQLGPGQLSPRPVKRDDSAASWARGRGTQRVRDAASLFPPEGGSWLHLAARPGACGKGASLPHDLRPEPPQSPVGPSDRQVPRSASSPRVTRAAAASPRRWLPPGTSQCILSAARLLRFRKYRHYFCENQQPDAASPIGSRAPRPPEAPPCPTELPPFPPLFPQPWRAGGQQGRARGAALGPPPRCPCSVVTSPPAGSRRRGDCPLPATVFTPHAALTGTRAAHTLTQR